MVLTCQITTREKVVKVEMEMEDARGTDCFLPSNAFARVFFSMEVYGNPRRNEKAKCRHSRMDDEWRRSQDSTCFLRYTKKYNYEPDC